MQSILTASIEFVFVGFAGLMLVQFVLGLRCRNRYSAAEVEQAAAEANLPDYAEFAPEPAPTVAEPAPLPVSVPVILPFVRRKPAPVADDLETRTIRELKAIASQMRLPNYSRLTKAQLVEAIRAARATAA